MAQASTFPNTVEYDVYGVITEAFILHKRPIDRYTIFPQLRLYWDLTDSDKLLHFRRSAMPDYCLGKYSLTVGTPHIRIQGGVEVKRHLETVVWEENPPRVIRDSKLSSAVHQARYQAQDQAKTVVKNKLIKSGEEHLTWLIFIGPYFTSIDFGPFNTDQLDTRSHKANDSGDFHETALTAYGKSKIPNYPMYRLGTREAERQLERFITSTARFLPA